MLNSTGTIRLALPSKGRMEGETLKFLAECGLPVNKTNPRQYTADIPAIPELEILFQRPRDIPKSVASGNVDLGITGYDTVYDAGGDSDNDIILIHEALGYGACSLVFAVPTTWDDVHDIVSLEAYASRQGGLRVGTKYVNSVQRFLSSHQLEEVIHIIAADGALEAAPAIGYADFVCDITSSGTTLRENNLKPLEDSVVVNSEAVWIGNRKALQERDRVLNATAHMLEFIEAHLRASNQYMIFANMRGSSAQEIADRIYSQTHLGGLQGPTIAPVISPENNGGWWAINIIVQAPKLYEAIQKIREIDGSGVVATPVKYIFDESPVRYKRLLEQLGKEETPV